MDHIKLTSLLSKEEIEACNLSSSLLLLSGKFISISLENSVVSSDIISSFYRSKSTVVFGFYKPISKY